MLETFDYVCYNKWTSPKDITEKLSWANRGEFTSILMLYSYLKIITTHEGLKG